MRDRNMIAEIGPLLIPALVVLVVVVCVAAVIVMIGLTAFVILGVVGVLAISDRVERAKQCASEVGLEDAW